PLCMLPLKRTRTPAGCCRCLRTSGGETEGLQLPSSSFPFSLGLPPPGRPRALGIHPKKELMEVLNTAQGDRNFIYSLHSTERSCLLWELHSFESIHHTFVHNALPFVGFGFLDNGIMIIAAFNWSCPGNFNYGGCCFGKSCFDLVGLGLPGYVEALGSRLCLSIQADMWQTCVSAGGPEMGQGGVALGCVAWGGQSAPDLGPIRTESPDSDPQQPGRGEWEVMGGWQGGDCHWWGY
uniref:Uncharacterized protein n=1 Tax=Sphenodon punctatus TaxID=8508 RepID=A0A8D0HG08_SPHPU